jgi:hypothetical protein
MAYVSTFNAITTGTSANAYPSDPQYQNDRIGTMAEKVVSVQNTDGANAIDYQIKVKTHLDGDYTNYPPGASEMELAAGADAIVAIPEAYSEIAVEVKSAVADSHGTFAVSMGARGV